MHFFIDILTAGIMAYLSLTNTWANQIETWLSQNEDMEHEEVSITPESVMIESNTALGGISNILRQSTAYQQAALQAAITPNIPTTNTLNALVNILCISTTRSHIRTTTGTGFFIHSDGVILTNAHVAQYLLLTRTDTLGKTECTVRTGNPAAPQYEADILYISPTWIIHNAANLSNKSPTGTGERDYALLYVTKSVDESPLPRSFPALEVDTTLISRTITGTGVFATGYPAESLLRDAITTNLIPKQARTIVTDLFTFGSNYADVMALAGSTVGEHGASGGPITTSTNKVIAMITTKGDDSRDGVGSLRAITLSYIDRTIQEETGFPLVSTISGDLSMRAKIFTDTMVPFLREVMDSQNTTR